VTEFIPKLRQKADEFLTNYLRDTTTDQEILDFYGEGNIIGRKGIPESRRELLDQVFSSKSKNRPKLLHNFDAYDESYGDKVPKHVYETIDMPANSPTTGRPWQMTFGKFPFPHEGQATPAANQFLNDFRVPSRPVDYGFDTGPNILDRNERDITNIKEDLHSYERAVFCSRFHGSVCCLFSRTQNFLKVQHPVLLARNQHLISHHFKKELALVII
jgi:hypothetical protein